MDAKSEQLLSGRRAVVVGGARGIGRAIVDSFVAQGAVVLSVDADSGAGADRDGVEELVWDVRHGRVPPRVMEFDADVLVNNVGHFLRPQTPFADADPAEWTDLHDINFGYALRTTYALLPSMIAAGRGVIINLTTVEAHRAIPGHTVYSAYKAALTQFTRSLAAEVGHHGIRVNAIAPDLIETPQVPYADLVPPEQEHLWPHWSPLGGPGQPVDVAGAAVFLVSDLSRFTTGTTLHVGGGTEIAGGWVRRDDDTWTNRPVAP